MATSKFVPKDKKSKKARRAENAAGRVSWEFNPATRRKESGKAYNRQRFKKEEE